MGLFGLACACLAMICFLQLGNASVAKAGVAEFCGNVYEPGYGICEEYTYPRTDQDYGWGDEHSVCVGLRPLTVEACSGGPGQGVYSGKLPEFLNADPWIANHAAGYNYVHGVYFTP